MTSKNLFFKLLRERAKQSLWLIALSILTAFFAFPVASAVLTGYTLDADRISSMAEMSEGLLTVEASRKMAQAEAAEIFYHQIDPAGPLLILLLTAGAVICGLAGFSYLFSRKKTDFYHSIPVRREMIFTVSYVSGILYAAVPYLAGLLTAAVLVQVKIMPYTLDWGRILASFGQGMAFYILSYSTAVAAAMLTGHLAVSVLGTLVFFFWGPAILLLIRAYCGYYFQSFYYLEGVMENIAPEFASPLLFQIASSGERIGIRAAAALAAGLVIGGVSLFLYKKRPSETAGRAMVFKASRPVIKMALMLSSALGASLFFCEVGGAKAWGIFGLICGIIISDCVIEVIYHFDFRRALAGKRSAAAGAVLSVFVFCLFRFDLAGFDTYLPDASEIESVGFECHNLYSGLRKDRATVTITERRNGEISTYSSYPEEREVLAQMTISDPETVKAILGIAQGGISEIKNSKKPVQTPELTVNGAEGEPERVMGRVVIQYHLKNGRTATRNYYMDLSKVWEEAELIYASRDFKEESYPVMQLKADEIAGANFEVFGIYSHVEAEREKIAELLTVYQEEFYGLTLDEQTEEVPLGFIQFKTLEMQEIIDEIREKNGDYTWFNDFAYYPVYPEFEKTVAVLREVGVEMADRLTPDRVERIVVRDREYTDEQYSENAGAVTYVEEGMSLHRTGEETYLEITSKERMGEILKASGSYGNSDLWESDTRFGIEIYLAPENQENSHFFREGTEVLYFDFVKGKTPQFVAQIFEQQKENPSEIDFPSFTG